MKLPGIMSTAWNLLVKTVFGFTYCLNWIRHLTKQSLMSINTFINVKIYNTYGSTLNWIERSEKPNCNWYQRLKRCCCQTNNIFGSRSGVDVIDMQSSSHHRYNWIMVYLCYLAQFCILRPLTSNTEMMNTWTMFLL